MTREHGGGGLGNFVSEPWNGASSCLFLFTLEWWTKESFAERNKVQGIRGNNVSRRRISFEKIFFKIVAGVSHRVGKRNVWIGSKIRTNYMVRKSHFFGIDLGNLDLNLFFLPRSTDRRGSKTEQQCGQGSNKCKKQSGRPLVTSAVLEHHLCY